MLKNIPLPKGSRDRLVSNTSAEKGADGTKTAIRQISPTKLPRKVKKVETGSIALILPSSKMFHKKNMIKLGDMFSSNEDVGIL